jgi:hypothetical protein
MYGMAASRKTVTMQFNVQGREDLRAAYDAARMKRETSFEFRGYELCIDLAKHLLEELDQQLGPNERPRLH